jgi:aspartokinase
MINQGASEISILFGVREEDAAAAVRAIHDEYF